MTSKTSADGTVQNYTYDGNANVLSYNMAKDGETKNSITYTYNAMNRLTQLEKIRQGIPPSDFILTYISSHSRSHSTARTDLADLHREIHISPAGRIRQQGT